MGAADAAVNNTNKSVRFENLAPFTSCKTKINIVQVYNAEDIDTVMPMYNLIEYSNAYLKKSESLWKYYKDESALDNIIDFLANNNKRILFNSKQQIAGETGKCSRKDVEIMVPLKHLSHFCRTFEMPLINCEISLQLTCSEKLF